MRGLLLLAVIGIVGCASAPSDHAGGDSADMTSDDAAPQPTQSVDITGDWTGTIKVGGTSLPTVFHITRNDDGSYAATMDSPDQGAYGIKVDSVTVTGDAVVFAIGVAQAEYDATVSEGADTMTGVFKQRGAEIDLVMTKQEGMVGPPRPQEPHPPFPYHVENVTFDNRGAGITLAGTLTMPNAGGEFRAPYPGIVLVTGSGPQNRDEEIFAHKPFLVIADALTRRGFAVLRYDDRGVGDSGGIFSTATSMDFKTDAESALAYLRSRSEIDVRKTGLIGHSEGGGIVPMVAADDPTVDFIVMLAGPGLPGAEEVVLQSQAIMRASGMSEDMIKVISDANRRVYQAILDNPDDNVAAAAVTKIMKEIGVPQDQIDAQLTTLLSPWYRQFLAYEPLPTLEKLTCAVLVLNGTLDLQVPYEQNLAATRKALEKAPTDQYTIEVLPGLNHLFQHATTGLVDEYAKIEETVAPEVLKIIGDWLTEVTTGSN